jgi:calcineurin-like phosphoesterase family protein
MITSLKLDHQRVWFISDSHHLHGGKDGMGGVLLHDSRPFSNIDEHDEAIIANWNSVVNKTDVVIHGGDVSFGSSNKTNSILERLNGQIYLVLGNHDKMKDVKKYVNIKEYASILDLYIEDETAIDKLGNRQHLILSHYPIIQWSRKGYNSIHLHGHSHQNLVNNPVYDWYYKQLVMDIGCNGINYTPISYQEVKTIMLNKLNNKDNV